MWSNSLVSISELPSADEHALSHSEALQKIMRRQIDNNNGDISFARFMQMALYEPGLGYYSAGASKIGEGGDFVTAPEISSLFSICLARQCAEVMSELSQAVILELGAGTGVMASDVLKELQKQGCLPLKYCILEPSADLRQRQEQLLNARIPDLLPIVQWLDVMPDEPFDGIVLANEVLDAMPVQRFQLEQGNIYELRVEWHEDGFAWSRCTADEELEQRVGDIIRQSKEPFRDGYSSEINVDLDAWLKSLSDCLHTGLMIFIDYGYSRHEYYHEQRMQGTLLCHYRHRAHSDPFVFVGLQDISASVDFTAVAEAGLKAGLKVSGFTNQTSFLLACGLEQIMQEMNLAEVSHLFEITRQIKILTLPGEMGERFKVIALSRGIENAQRGFSLVDHRRRL